MFYDFEKTVSIFRRSLAIKYNQMASSNAVVWFFQWSYMDVRVGLQRKLSTKKLMLLNCGVGEDS